MIKKIYSDNRVIFWDGKKNEDFIRLLALRIKEYATIPKIKQFVIDKTPEDIYYYARNIISYARDPREYKGFLHRLIDLFGNDYKPYLKQYEEFLKEKNKEMELIIAPPVIIDMFNRGIKVIGDCDDKTLFLGSCLVAMGYPVKVVGAMFIKDSSSRGINHVYLEYQDETGEWIPLEASTYRLRFGEKSDKAIPLMKILVSPEIKYTASYLDALIKDSVQEIDSIKEKIWTI